MYGQLAAGWYLGGRGGYNEMVQSVCVPICTPRMLDGMDIWTVASATTYTVSQVCGASTLYAESTGFCTQPKLL